MRELLKRDFLIVFWAKEAASLKRLLSFAVLGWPRIATVGVPFGRVVAQTSVRLAAGKGAGFFESGLDSESDSVNLPGHLHHAQVEKLEHKSCHSH